MAWYDDLGGKLWRTGQQGINSVGSALGLMDYYDYDVDKERTFKNKNPLRDSKQDARFPTDNKFTGPQTANNFYVTNPDTGRYIVSTSGLPTYNQEQTYRASTPIGPTGPTGPTQEQIDAQNRQNAYDQQVAAQQAEAQRVENERLAEIERQKGIARENLGQGKTDLISNTLYGANSYKDQLAKSIRTSARTSLKEQEAIDAASAANLQAKNQGYGNILEGVGTNIRSGQNILANRNAGDSSAAQEMAALYGKMGEKQMGQVNQQFATADEQVGKRQKNLEEEMDIFKSEEIIANKDKYVRDITKDANDTIQQLNNAARNANIEDKIAIEGEIQNAINQATAQLSQLEGMWTEATKNVKSRGRAGDAQEAMRLQDQGMPVANAFSYQANPRGEFQGNTDVEQDTPLFTLPKKKNEYAGGFNALPAQGNIRGGFTALPAQGNIRGGFTALPAQQPVTFRR